MKRLTSLFTLLICSFAAFLLAAPMAVAQEEPDPLTDPAWTPEITLQPDTSYNLCTGDSACFWVSGYDFDASDSLTLTLLDGPISYAPKKLGREFTEHICFAPSESGTYRFIWQLSDKSNRKDTDTAFYTIVYNQRPTALDKYSSAKFCYGPETRKIQVHATDPDGDILTYTLLSGSGSMNSSTGLLQYLPAGEGIFNFTYEVRDRCSADTGTVVDTITLNQKPYFAWTDSTFYLCAPDEICAILTGIDPEGLDMEIRLEAGDGTLTRLSDSTAKLCFNPMDVDSATYTFIVCVADRCPAGSLTEETTAWPVCYKDTLHVTVIINRPPQLACPESIDLGNCHSEGCFEISAIDPEGGALTYEILSDNATIDGTTICVTGEGDSLMVMVRVIDDCDNADTCTIPVKRGIGHPPYVTLPNDFSMTVCQPEEICFDAFADDQDFDIATVVTNFGTYDPNANRICFTADTTGTYAIILTATDQCGSMDSDTIFVQVQVNRLPIVQFSETLDSAICFTGELCYDLSIFDDNLKSVWTSYGTYNPETGKLCFTPLNSGTFTVIARATDDCNKIAEDTLTVVVTIGSAPVISPMLDTTVTLCQPTYVCLPVTITDPENDIASIAVNRGQLKNGTVCFVPYSQGAYPVIVTVTDGCGFTVADTAIVTVKTDQAVVLSCPRDTTIFLCEPETLCFPVGGVPADARVRVIGTAAYWNVETQSICFYSECCLENTIKFEVTTACGTVRFCEFTVKVKTNTAPIVLLPRDTTLGSCANGEICLPVGISDQDNNIVSVQATGGTYDQSRGIVCVNTANGGTFVVTVAATDACGATSSDNITITTVNNLPPMVDFGPTDTLFEQCAPTQICLPIAIADGNNNLQSITTALGRYDAELRAICFVPEGAGQYCAEVVVMDSCGVSDTANLCVTVIASEYVGLTCPPATDPITICGPDTLCYQIGVTGPYSSLSTSYGTLDGTTLCIPIDTTGTYTVLVIATGSCNADTCAVIVPVQASTPVDVACPGTDTSLFVCALPINLQFPVTITGTVDQMTVFPAGAFYEAGFIKMAVTEPGTYEVGIVVENGCSKDSCSFGLTVNVNQPPMVVASPDTTILLCGDTGYVAFTYTVSDPDGNISEITSSLGIIEDDLVIFRPTAAGSYPVVLTVKDACGKVDQDTTVVTVVTVPRVDINCPPSPITRLVTLPDTVRVAVGITPANIPVQVLPDGYYDWATGEVVVYAPTSGNYTYTLIVNGDCNTDTCTLKLELGQYFPPFVECIGSVDTLLCLTGIDTICLPVSVSGTGISVSVSPYGTYENGNLCLPVSESGTYTMQIIASNAQEADTCYSTIVVRSNSAPSVSLSEPFSASICDQTDVVCYDLTSTDLDENIASVVTNLGAPVFQSGRVQYCFSPDTAGVYRVIAEVVDSCGLTAFDTTFITVEINVPPLVTLGLDQSGTFCAGQTICLPLTITDDNIENVQVTGGVYNAETGEVCVESVEPGTYTIIATATDSCGAMDADTAVVTVNPNTAPTAMLGADTTVYLCKPVNVCLPLTYSDLDGNIASVTVNRGQISNGTVCFVPYSQGTYPIIVTVTDSCGLQDVDTALVTVQTDQAISLTCPTDTTIFLCEPDTLCFPLGGVPAGATVVVRGTAAYWDAQKQSVCFYSECCLQNTISVDVFSACGSTFTCEFTVNVKTNTAPIVLLPHDTTIVQCDLTQICIPVGITDNDHNLTGVSATGGTYDASRGVVCFTPTASGRYTISVTATDACGKIGTDQIQVTVRLNTKPFVLYTPGDTLYTQCEFETICLPIQIVDVDNNVTSINVIGGTYDAANNQVCFLPTAAGRVYVSIVATDACGLKDSIRIWVHVNAGGVAEIACNTVPTQTLCAPQQVCVPLAITGHDYTVSTTLGIWSAGTLCFDADTSGLYTIRVIASGSCTSDTCVVNVPVTIQPAVEFTSCPGNQTAFLCGPDTLCYTFAVSSSATNVRVSTGGFINGNQICVPITLAGTKTVRLIAEGQCGVDTCLFTVTSTFNSSPNVTARDSALTICTLTEICIPFVATDPNNNIQTITSSLGQVVGSSVCFTPPSFGVHTITITATDSCGMAYQKQVRVTVNLGPSAVIVCPEGDQFVSLCKPDSVHIIVPISPSGATVTVLPAGRYNPTTGRVSVYVTTGGTYPITVIAASQCGADTCTFNLKVDMGQAPAVTCPGTVDTTMCLVTPQQLCFPVTVTGTGVQVTVTPAGATYQAGFVCVPVTTAGQFYVKVSATGTCGTAVCSTLVDLTANQRPSLTLPVGLSYERCPDDTNTICVSGISATDAESAVTVTKLCGPGTLSADVNGYKICFKPESVTPQKFCIQVTDGCHTLVDTLDINITLKPDCDVCARVEIDGGTCTPVGLRKAADLRIKTNDPIGGFDLLITYDPSALSFQTALISGTDIQGWEYFTYNLNSASCGSACPPGLVRLIGIAEVNNGSNHPPDSTFLPDGMLVRMEYQVSNNQNLGDQFVPISFVWYDCGDNSFSDKTGNVLYIDKRIYNAEGILIWDEENNTLYPESSRQFGMGAPDNCLSSGAKGMPLRCVDFVNGGICIIHPDSIDDRGDINLNDQAYEIADAVLFSRYFIYGLSVFVINQAGQIAATDVNADGLTLTVADLTTLIRVVVGDIPPIPKLSPYQEYLTVSTEPSDGAIRINTNAVSTIGAAYLVCKVPSGTTLGEPRLLGSASGMELISSVENGELRLLIFNIGKNRIEAGKQSLVEIPVVGDGGLSILKADFCDYEGRPYVTASKNSSMPGSFTLAQNYPNPFNPSTTISFALPNAAAWQLTIYNVNGGVVREFAGDSEAGVNELVWDGTADNGTTVASGVYFYRLQAGSLSQTKKMMLLK
ncbi:MAG: T9SS type A sorting domain-containing protein [bacterium]|nr:T9SS type A sorting domain-containing protein [bacterium]